MSNVGANNRFLQSNLTRNDLASETTLKDIDQKLTTGIEANVDITDIGGTAVSTNIGDNNAGCIRIAQSIPTYFSQAMSQDGGGININANGDYSGGGATEWLFSASANGTYIQQLNVYIEDGGTFTSGFYGGTGVALTNGIEIQVDDGVNVPLNDDIPIRSNGDWAILSNYIQQNTNIVDTDSNRVCITFSTPIELNSGGDFIIALNDDFTGLTKHYFQVHGFTV